MKMSPSIFPQAVVEPMLTAQSDRILSVTTPWQGGSLLSILRSFHEERRVLWQDAKSSRGLAGIGAADLIIAHGANRFESIRQQARDLFQRITPADPNASHSILPVLAGGFSFTDEPSPDGMWSAFPSALFVLPRLQWTRVDGQNWLTINQPVVDGDLRRTECILTEERERLEVLARHAVKTDVSEVVDVQIQPLLSNPAWNQMAGEAIRQIRHGNLEKVVLARGVDVHLDQPIDPIGVLALLEERYPECTRFLIEPAPGKAFLGATPETLATLVGGELRTIALAGSTRRGASAEEDDVLAKTLMDSPKERHEHALVVEAIRSRLTSFVDGLDIEAQPGLWRLSNIQHLRTNARGRLHEAFDILDVIEALHPTPALGGTPRREALSLIEELEPTSRGWYASPVGWMDASGDGEFAVAIRSAVVAGTEARLHAGAGIVADSDPQREWDETALKLRPMLEALRGKL